MIDFILLKNELNLCYYHMLSNFIIIQFHLFQYNNFMTHDF